MVVIGTPIMVAAKSMDTGEDGLMGAAKTGYYMAFNLFLRPTLMIVGLILAQSTSRVLALRVPLAIILSANKSWRP